MCIQYIFFHFFFVSLSPPLEFSSNNEFYCKSIYASLTFIERETAPFYQVLSRKEFNLISSNLVAAREIRFNLIRKKENQFIRFDRLKRRRPL